jgi:hypothetical protein
VTPQPRNNTSNVNARYKQLINMAAEKTAPLSENPRQARAGKPNDLVKTVRAQFYQD